MSNSPSKGMLALRLSANKAEKIKIGGDTFCFRKLTVALEDEVEAIIKKHQDPTLKQPADLAEGASEADKTAYVEAFLAYKRAGERNFRALTADLMKFVLLDEADKPLFDPDDDVYGTLDNVYAAKFFQAYSQFRNGAQAEATGAEARFPK